ncbi:MAG: hypothetical protein JWM74_2260, partial [Myxococcaceae bacterium]|nr:hypothetical protein [Myxococcaceae bacterium]
LLKVEPRIGTVELAGASLPVRVDHGEPQSLPATLRLSAGVHGFEVVLGPAVLKWSLALRPGVSERREVFVRDGVPVLRGAEAVSEMPAPAERPIARTGRPSGVPTPSLVGYGVATVATAGAVVFGLSTLSARDHYRDDGARSRFYLDRALTNVCLGIALVAVVASTIVWLGSGPPSR